MLLTALVVIHDTVRGGEDDVTEVTRGEEGDDPLLELLDLDIETGRDDSALVDTSDEVDDDLSVAAVIDDFELADVL